MLLHLADDTKYVIIFFFFICSMCLITVHIKHLLTGLDQSVQYLVEYETTETAFHGQKCINCLVERSFFYYCIVPLGI